MPPFLSNLRRILPFGPEEEDFRTPDFNPLARRKPLPPAGRPIPTVQSEQPQLPRPARPLPMGGEQLPISMSPAPNPDQQEYPNYRPMMMAQRPSPQAPIPVSDQRPSVALERPRMQPMPDIHPLGSPGVSIPDNPIDRAKFDYTMQGMDRDAPGLKIKRSLKDTLLSTAGGLLQGGLPGAAVRGITALASPRMGREQNFQQFYQPGIEQALQRQQQDEARRQAQAMQGLNLERGQVGLDQERAQTDLYKMQAKLAQEKALNPAIPREDPRRGVFNTPRGTLNLGDMRIIEGTEPLPREQRLSPSQQLVEAETERAGEQGSPEEIAESSYQARGGDQYVFSKLRPEIQEVLQQGTFGTRPATAAEIATAQETVKTKTLSDGKAATPADIASAQEILQNKIIPGSAATPEEIATAERSFQQAIKRQRDADMDYTKGAARREASARVGQRKSGSAKPVRSGGTPSASGTRSLAELEELYFNQPKKKR